MTFVDFHSHVLPGIDDGSKDLEQSLEMLRMEVIHDIDVVVATPHFYPGRDDPESFLKRREQAEKQLRMAMASEDNLPQLEIGAEVYFFRGISQSDLLSDLTIRGTKYILIEMPHGHWPEEYYRELYQIRDRRGICPIIAHVDRYIAPFQTHGIPAKLEQLPVLVQANASFFLNRPTANMAMKMLKKGQIHLLGSDCHNMSSRKPNLGPCFDDIFSKLGEDALEHINYYQTLVFE